MPTAPRDTVLCRYHYDPLDRLADCAPAVEASTQRFYCKSRLATEIQEVVQHSVFQHEDQLLAQLRREDVTVNVSLLATDQQRSVLNVLDASKLQSLVYTPYGHRLAENGLLSLLGFNGERPDPVTGHYLLGNGYRAFNPVLMRFNSPDSWSPFGEGGLNAYAYCVGDPTNKTDPTGHFSLFKGVRSLWRSLFKSSKTHYKREARLAQRNSTQKGIELERLKQFNATNATTHINELRYEAIIANQADKIEGLKAINNKLRELLQRQLNNKIQPPTPSGSDFPPPIPPRPAPTLTSQAAKADLWDKNLAYLDLAQTSQAIRDR
jgi:RHS repeat-associated protein